MVHSPRHVNKQSAPTTNPEYCSTHLLLRHPLPHLNKLYQVPFFVRSWIWRIFTCTYDSHQKSFSLSDRYVPPRQNLVYMCMFPIRVVPYQRRFSSFWSATESMNRNRLTSSPICHWLWCNIQRKQLERYPEDNDNRKEVLSIRLGNGSAGPQVHDQNDKFLKIRQTKRR